MDRALARSHCSIVLEGPHLPLISGTAVPAHPHLRVNGRSPDSWLEDERARFRPFQRVSALEERVS
jgi:hypothetical protein